MKCFTQNTIFKLILKISSSTWNLVQREYKISRGCASRSPDASQTQLGRVKAICDLARLASGIIVVISVFNSLGLGSTCFRLCGPRCSLMCTALHAYVVWHINYNNVYKHAPMPCVKQTIQNYNVRYHPLSTSATTPWQTLRPAPHV